MMKRKLMATVLCAAAVGTLVAAEAGDSKKAPSGKAAPAAAMQRPAPSVAVGKVQLHDVKDVRYYTGLVAAKESVALVTRVNGTLIYQGFNDGDFVKKGQLLFQIDPVPYEAKLKSAEASVKEVKARLRYAENNYNRLKELYDKQATSKDSMETALSTLEAYKANLQSAEANLTTAQLDLGYTKITAPLAGKMGVATYSVGNYLTTGSGTLATIVQTDPIRVVFSISNRDFLSKYGTEQAMRDNSKMVLHLADDSIYEQHGTIDFVDNTASRTTDTLKIYVNFANPANKLIANGTVTVEMHKMIDQKMAAVTPAAVMFDENGHAYVYVLDDKNMPQKRTIKLGSSVGDLQYIVSGVEPDENVVVDGQHKIIPGVAVNPVLAN